MPERKWSASSKRVHNTLDPRLKVMVNELLVYMDVSLTYGYRNKVQQNDLYARKLTQVRYPDSKHNVSPSLAVDLQPWPYPTERVELWAALGYMAGLCKLIAERNGFKIRWGGDWDRDGDVTDNKFDDLFHIEVY